MSIYVGDRKAKLYKGDYRPAQLFKGNQKIAGYNIMQKCKPELIYTDTYKDKLNGIIYGKSEQKVTAPGKNLWTTDAVYPVGIVGALNYNPQTQEYSIEKNGDSMIRSIYKLKNPIPAGVKISCSMVCLGGNIAGTIIFGGYHEGTPASWQGVAALGEHQNEDLTGKTFTQTIITTDTVTDFYAFVYGGYTIKSPLKFKMQYQYGEATPYEPFMVDSPSALYPSPIKSAENFDFISENMNKTIQDISHITNSLCSIRVCASSTNYNYIDEEGNKCISDFYEISNDKVWYNKLINEALFDDTKQLNNQPQVLLEPPIRSDITADLLGQSLLSMRIHENYTKIYSTAFIKPFIKASVKVSAK